MLRSMVGVHFCIDPDLLERINSKIEGESQSEKLRKCVQEGYKRLKVKT